ncbi:hypothetical protein L6452_02616 [Arctium lappa]|uniref:Uncharacterized protein n=1 Tax=Arctium lappa TaxID=4217 RepID=A0ACB9FJW2_ARCLA|nr:hypothetical protein L6452_02616 [Arctium lappa]
MLKKEEEILSAVKEKQEKVVLDVRANIVEDWHRNVVARARYTKSAPPITCATFCSRRIGRPHHKTCTTYRARVLVTISKKTMVVQFCVFQVQIIILEQVNSSARPALLRTAAAQLGKYIESIGLHVELLHQFESSNFPTQRERI